MRGNAAALLVEVDDRGQRGVVLEGCLLRLELGVVIEVVVAA